MYFVLWNFTKQLFYYLRFRKCYMTETSAKVIGNHGSTVGALNAENPERTFSKKTNGHEIVVFLTDLHRIFHARSCMHFQWFPHARWPPRPLNHLKTSIYFGAFSRKYIFIILRSPWRGVFINSFNTIFQFFFIKIIHNHQQFVFFYTFSPGGNFD